MAAWIKRNRKRKLVVLSGLVGLFLAGILVVQIRSLTIRARFTELMDNPEPFPPYILAVSPIPGITCPGPSKCDDSLLPRATGKVCVDFNLWLASNDVMDSITIFKRTELRLNGKLIDSYQPLEARLRGKRIPISTISIPIRLDEQVYAAPRCWNWEPPPGDYLAKFTIHTEDGEELSYEWAFRIK